MGDHILHTEGRSEEQTRRQFQHKGLRGQRWPQSARTQTPPSGALALSQHFGVPRALRGVTPRTKLGYEAPKTNQNYLEFREQVLMH